jgi:hypothetical protein
MYFYKIPDRNPADITAYTSMYGDPYAAQNRETRILQTAIYLLVFRLRHPLAYFLWYRHRILLNLTKTDREEICAKMNELDKKQQPLTSFHLMLCRDDEFALWQPFLFVFVDAFQALKKSVFTRI